MLPQDQPDHPGLNPGGHCITLVPEVFNMFSVNYLAVVVSLVA